MMADFLQLILDRLTRSMALDAEAMHVVSTMAGLMDLR